MFTIGEFSKITGLTVKTLRFYHEQGLLVPSHIDEQTGYRYYHDRQTDTARVISELRALEFPLAEIAELLRNYHDDSDIVGHLEQQQQKLATQAEHYRQVEKRLNQIIQHQREVKTIMKTESFEVEEKQIEPLRIAGVRMKGKYSDCGAGLSTIGRRLGATSAAPASCCITTTNTKQTTPISKPAFPCAAVQSRKKRKAFRSANFPAANAFRFCTAGRTNSWVARMKKS